MVGEVPVRWGKNRRGWHLDKSVSVSHVLTVIGVVVGMVLQIQDLKNTTESQGKTLERLEYMINRRADACGPIAWPSPVADVEVRVAEIKP